MRQTDGQREKRERERERRQTEKRERVEGGKTQ